MPIFARLPYWSLGVGLALAACGDSVTFVECPAGTLPQGSECVPLSEPDTSGVDSLTPPDVADSVSSLSDSVDGPDSAVVTDSSGDTEISVDVEAQPQPTGGPCDKNADCEGGTCLDWPGGYCTLLGCEGAACGEHGACVAVEGGNRVCLAECERDSDCPSLGQACKRVADSVDGTLRRVCMGIREGAGATGAPCTDHLDCAGAAACLNAFPGGYCAVIGCEGSADCPAGAGCVRLDGRPTCLGRCASDGDCGGTASAERSCAVQRSVEGIEAPYCVSGAGDVSLGHPCLSDFECVSGTCQILGEGRCSQTDAPCFVATVDEDCNGAEFCFVTGDSRVGVCARACAAGGLSCPGASFCLAEGEDESEAWCRPACSFGGAECAGSIGLTCGFGVPITDGGQGRYVCGAFRARGFGDGCGADADCSSGECLRPEGGGDGYCTRPCGFDGYCPFSGACVFGAEERCYRACQSAADCPQGWSCELTAGSARDVCVP